MNQPANFKNATRCQHTKMNGQPCSAPARRGRRFCIFHDAANRKPQDFAVPILEDATSLQFAILQVMRALADKTIEPKTAALMLYGLQIAASNLRRFAEEQSPAHNQGDDPSLLRMLLDQFQNPQYEEELGRERAWENLDNQHSQPGNQQDHQSAAGPASPAINLPVERFDIKACASDEPPSHRLSSGQSADWLRLACFPVSPFHSDAARRCSWNSGEDTRVCPVATNSSWFSSNSSGT